MSHIELALSSQQLPDNNDSRSLISQWAKKLIRKEEHPIMPEDRYDQDILAVTQPFAQYFQNIAEIASQGTKLPEGFHLSREGKMSVLKIRQTTETGSREVALFDHTLKWAQVNNAVQLAGFSYKAENLSKDRPICTVDMSFDKTNHVQDVSLAWGVAKDQGGPYELMPFEGFGGIAIGNKQVRTFMDQYLCKLSSRLRDGETAQSSAKFTLPKPCSLAVQENYHSDIGFDRTVFDRKILGETIGIQSTFTYNPKTKLFERQFDSEKTARTYIARRNEDYRLDQSLALSREQYIKTLAAVLDILPFKPGANASQKLAKR